MNLVKEDEEEEEKKKTFTARLTPTRKQPSSARETVSSHDDLASLPQLHLLLRVVRTYEQATTVSTFMLHRIGMCRLTIALSIWGLVLSEHHIRESIRASKQLAVYGRLQYDFRVKSPSKSPLLIALREEHMLAGTRVPRPSTYVRTYVHTYVRLSIRDGGIARNTFVITISPLRLGILVKFLKCTCSIQIGGLFSGAPYYESKRETSGNTLSLSTRTTKTLPCSN